MYPCSSVPVDLYGQTVLYQTILVRPGLEQVVSSDVFETQIRIDKISQALGHGTAAVDA